VSCGHLRVEPDGRGTTIALAAGLVILGGALAAASWFRWLRVERAMRRGQGIPPSRLAPLLAAGIAVLAVLSVVGLVMAR
jgi:putative membrane protein